jgi:Ca2+-binding RTX toxin-like protein
MLYGANMSTRAGNTVYSYTVDPVTDGVLYQTLWDAGGNDTIDLSNQSGPSRISLVPGSFSTVGLFDPLDGLSGSVRTSAEQYADRYYDGSNALAIAFDCIIENARGGSAADVLIGNTAGNNLYGNGGNDTIEGSAGNDLLKGAAGRDRLDGGAGKDSLDGGGGIDTMVGGGGNDVFYVTAGDVVRESKGGGTDTVRSGVNFTLGNNVENLVLSGAKDVRGVGNTLANNLTGNNGDNTLIGNSGADVLKGNGGSDVLRGGAGSDKLTGGGGADSFRFDTKLGASNVDRVTDFKPGTDTVVLDQTVFAALATGSLDASLFHAGAGVVTAADADDRILFNTSTGALFYDADGTGGASSPVQFALLAGSAAATLSAGDFMVVA